MPTYAYACKDCGHAFDIQQSFSDDSLTVCPECRGNLRKKFNSVGVVFKGSGFYRTDSRAGSSTVPAASGTSGSASDSGASSTDSGAKTPAPAGVSSSGPASSASGSSRPASKAGAGKAAAPVAS
ncbi:FmdB family transcriptional regulator [Arthrobacter livingstonensis]|uniref:FmdB family transcriptional regulator n=1 Tax=Arthrobacter livingstonensis TaxID=670078 RepID=A0A2V5LJE1_9MICC|nr:FmdB family zinc ribbon protein [Arthrobacter livingstonensis]PYI67190.1 FmdB family transcriptional regulator [Arthrobacter livingstonensis]